MSVTFAVEFRGAEDVYGATIQCCCGAWETPAFTNYQEAIDAFPAVVNGCTDEDCVPYGLHVHLLSIVSGQPEANLSNRNALDLLRLLGIASHTEDGDLYGSIDPDDLIARALLGTVEPDEGLPSYDGPAFLFGGAVLAENVHDAGRAPGYLAARCAGLIEVAHAAKAMGRKVQWA